MKKLLFPIAVTALFASQALAQDATPNPFAYKMDVTQDIKPEITFYLNAPAVNVTLNLLDLESGKTVCSVDLGEGTQGKNTKTVEKVDAEPGNYAWSLTVKGKDLSAPVQVANSANNLVLQTVNASGIAINNNLGSPYFGNIYIASDANRYKTGERTDNGIYIVSPEFEDLTTDGKPFDGNVAWANTTSSPFRVTVAPNDDVYVCDWSDSHSGVWVMNAANPSDDWRTVFGGTRNGDGLSSNADGVAIHGSIVTIAVTGTGDETTLYTLDEDFVSPEDASAFTMLRYDLGSSTDVWTKAPSKIYTMDPTTLANGTNKFVFDGHGGAWISQKRSQRDVYPCLMHVNLETGAIDWTSRGEDGKEGIFAASDLMAAMNVTPDGRYIALLNWNENYILEATYDDNGVPTVELLYTFYGPGDWTDKIDGTMRSFDAAFDAAGNLYEIYNNNTVFGGVFVYAIPKPAGENICTTTPVSTEGVPNHFIVTSDISTSVANIISNSDVAPVYYDMMGRKVNNPEAGKLYIEVRGEKATKVNL
ncbi:MAG: hypothetical protein J1F20_07160 [Muribaculaceae bacterium]|nr:hypothetical protein [Muribaculaceae bacterium]